MSSVTIKNSQINYKIIDNFLNSNECDDLVADSNNILQKDNSSVIHGGRTFVSCVDNEFRNLRNNSSIWKKLTDKLSSNEFFEQCCKDLNIDSKKFKNIRYFNKSSVPSYEKKYRHINKLNLQTLNIPQLIKYLMLRIYKKFKKFVLIDILNFYKHPIEMLYDYSSAVNGYGREIHRDSDNRMIVCLLYLSALSNDSTGGNLKIYKHKDPEKSMFVAQPNEEDCEIIDTIKPIKGRLVIFENTEKSYHSVDRIENNTSARHFVCGNFTILKGKNPQMKNSINRLKTPFHMYY